MSDLEARLRALGDLSDSELEPLSSLRARNRRRRIRRRLRWSATTLVAAVAIATVAAWPSSRRDGSTVKVVAPVGGTSTTVPAAPTVPANPSGHFRAGWLPPGLWFDQDHTTQGVDTVASYSAPPAFSDATAQGPPETPESITITAGRFLAPPGAVSAGDVQRHPAESFRAASGDDVLVWTDRPGVTIQMTGHGVSLSTLRRVADSVYELPAGSPNLAASPNETTLKVPEPDGTRASLAVTEAGPTLCVRLQSPDSNGPCGDDPARHPIGIGVTTAAPYTLFGIAPPGTATVQVLLSSGQTLTTAAVASPSISQARFWAVAIPGAEPVAAVTADSQDRHQLAARNILIGMPGDPAPPWNAPALPSNQAPAAISQAWKADQDRSGCAPIGFAATDLPGATAHVAPFGDNGWGVGFDKPGEPGNATSGQYSPTGGHSVFGVACSGLPDIVHSFADWPHHIVWSDGSRADYGPQGFTGPVWIAFVHIRGQTNLYQIWSALGRQHLQYLLSQLRYVNTNS